MKGVLTQKIFACLHDDFFEWCLRCPLDMHLNERINAFAATSVITNLDCVAVVAKMNVGSLSAIITVDIEDLGVALGNALGRLLANPTHGSRLKRGCTFDNKRALS